MPIISDSLLQEKKHQQPQQQMQHQQSQQHQQQEQDAGERGGVELKALKLVCRLQEPLEFSAHLEAEIRARACRAPPILLATAARSSTCPPPPQRQRRSEQQQQLVIYPTTVALQNMETHGASSVGFHFLSEGHHQPTPSSPSSMVIVAGGGDLGTTEGLADAEAEQSAGTTFRLFYQLTPKRGDKAELKSEMV
jgi:hypothetical protein